jgi:hypothetical protein
VHLVFCPLANVNRTIWPSILSLTAVHVVFP